jgi:hypothetical protein
MSALTRPRGPHSPRVYWTRRLLLIATALALVVGIGSVLGRLSDGSGGDGAVTTVAVAEPDTSSVGPGQPSADTAAKTKRKSKKKAKDKKSRLPQPTGPCLPSDIAITPLIDKAAAGGDIKLPFRVGTRLTAACTWRVSPDSLTLKITSGSDLIWTSQQCPRTIPSEDLVLRSSKPTRLTVIWSGKRSDDECSKDTRWAMPGWYHVAVAPLGGEPQDVQFRLVYPQAPVVTASPSPKQKDTKSTEADGAKNAKKNGKQGGRTKSPTASPSGAVEPNG